MESGTGKGKVVGVTGASGFIASWLVKLLLFRGYTVKATVRDPNHSVKVDHLLKLDGAEERLQPIKANLMEEGSFDQAVEGCEVVFHTASPVTHNVKDPQTELIDPAVKGTLNFLKSCAKSPCVKRVILTSSTAAVVYNGKSRTPEVIVDETWFLNPDISREYKDVANAHIQAFEISSASGGRYCLVETVAHYSDIVKILHQLYPTLPLPEKCADDKPFVPKYQVSKEKAKTLGIEFIPLKVTLKETVESFKEKNFINF